MKKLTYEELYNVPTIDLGDIYLRGIEYNDYKDLYEYCSDPEVTKTLLFDTYKSIDDAIYSMENIFLVKPKQGIPLTYVLVHKEDNKMIGTCDIFKVDYENELGEIGYALNRNYWGKGFMTKACRALIKFGFEYLGLKKIEIAHKVGNIGSRRVIEKSGFRYIKEVFHERSNAYAKTYEMMHDEVIIRKADKHDAKGKGHVHYNAWIEVYTGLINQDYLDARSEEKCVEMAEKYPENTYVATIAGNIVGFACYNEARDDDKNNVGEVRAVYILEKYHRRGIGKKLMDICLKEFTDYNEVIVWCLATNQNAIDFYEHLGFKKDGKEKHVKASETTTLHEVRLIIHK